MTDETQDQTVEPILTPAPEVPAFLLAPVQTEVPTSSEVPASQLVSTQEFPGQIEPPVHPAVSIISEIEDHLQSLSLYGTTENAIRKLIADLKTFF